MIIRSKQSEKPFVKKWPLPPSFVFYKKLRWHKFEAVNLSDPKWLLSDNFNELFKHMHFCAYYAHRLYNNGDRIKKKEYLYFLGQHDALRQFLVNANVGLVYNLLGKYGERFRFADPDELRSEGLMALLRSIVAYDPWRGFKFSTYACNSIIRCFFRYINGIISKPANFQTREDLNDVDIVDKTSIETDDLGLITERIKLILDQNKAELNDIEIDVIKSRFAVNKEKLEDIGDRYECSKEKIRHVQLNALEKIKMALELDPVLQ